MGKKILGLIVTIFVIWAGLSGRFVLIGTNSSTALVVVGFIFLIGNIISIVTHKEEEEVSKEEKVSNIVLPEHLERAAELIEQGMKKEAIFQTLKSEGLAWKEASDAYYKAFHIHLTEQENGQKNNRI